MYMTCQLQFNGQAIHITFFSIFSYLFASLGLGKTSSFHVVTKSIETGDDVVRAYICAGTHCIL